MTVHAILTAAASAQHAGPPSALLGWVELLAAALGIIVSFGVIVSVLSKRIRARARSWAHAFGRDLLAPTELAHKKEHAAIHRRIDGVAGVAGEARHIATQALQATHQHD